MGTRCDPQSSITVVAFLCVGPQLLSGSRFLIIALPKSGKAFRSQLWFRVELVKSLWMLHRSPAPLRAAPTFVNSLSLEPLELNFQRM